MSLDKPEDLLFGLAPGGAGGQRRAGASLFTAGAAGGFISVAMGITDSQLLDNTDAVTQPGEPIRCGVLGGASLCLVIQPQESGAVEVDTLGSAIDTVLAVYHWTNLFALYSGLLDCDDNSADGLRSRLVFNAKLWSITWWSWTA